MSRWDRVAAAAACASESAGKFPGLVVGQDPGSARRLGEQVQADRDRRVARLLDAANSLAAIAADGLDDEVGWYAGRLARDVRAFAARLVHVPEPSRIRHEVPGVGRG